MSRLACFSTLLLTGLLASACGDATHPTEPAPEWRVQQLLTPSATGRIAFVSDRTGNAEIYTMDPDGTGLVRLTDDLRGDYRPAWSPDRSRIAWSRTDAVAGFTIWVMNSDGTNPQQLDTGNGLCPTWSPDGSRIAFVRGPSYGDLMVINADGTNLVNLTNSPLVYDGCPDWSPDGERLVFAGQQVGPNYQIDLYTIDPDGGPRVLLLSDLGGAEAYPAWSPDGSKVLYSYNSAAGPGQGGKDGLWVVNADGTGLVRILNENGTEGVADWSPDGSRIVYGGFASDWEIYTVNPDGTGRTRLTYEHKVYDAQPNWR